jgi:hypothetical protein
MARGVNIEERIDITRPIGEVFAFVADQTNEPLYNRQMMSSAQTTEEPVGVGTTFRARTRSRGTPVEMVIEVTEFDPPRQLRGTTQMASVDLDGGLKFTSIPSGTRMGWDWNVRPAGVAGMRPAVRAIGQRNERRIWNALKDHLEHTAGSSDRSQPDAGAGRRSESKPS